MEKSENLRVRIAPELKAKVKLAATQEGLTISAFITRLLTLKTQEI